jgi:hypothetical protein
MHNHALTHTHSSVYARLIAEQGHVRKQLPSSRLSAHHLRMEATSSLERPKQWGCRATGQKSQHSRSPPSQQICVCVHVRVPILCVCVHAYLYSS